MKHLALALALISTSAFAEESAPASESAPSSASETKASGEGDAAKKDDTKNKNKETDASAPADNTFRGMILPVGKLGIVTSVSFPQLLEVGIDTRLFDKMLGLGFAFGPKMGTKVGTAEVGLSHWGLNANWHPFHGTFFLGAAYGMQTLEASLTTDMTNPSAPTVKVPTTLKGKIESSYLTPKLGWHGLWDSGFTIGTELGWQMPQGVKTTITTEVSGVSDSAKTALESQDDYKKAKADVEKAGDTLGAISLPYWKLLQLGWLF